MLPGLEDRRSLSVAVVKRASVFGSLSSYYYKSNNNNNNINNEEKETITVSTSNAIFVFFSDIGLKVMTKLILEIGGLLE